jgi:hypothetical protein
MPGVSRKNGAKVMSVKKAQISNQNLLCNTLYIAITV